MSELEEGKPDFVISNLQEFWVIFVVCVAVTIAWGTEFIVSLIQSNDRWSQAFSWFEFFFAMVCGIQLFRTMQFGRWEIQSWGIQFDGIWGAKAKLNWSDVTRIKWRRIYATLEGGGIRICVPWGRRFLEAREFAKVSLSSMFDLTEIPKLKSIKRVKLLTFLFGIIAFMILIPLSTYAESGAIKRKYRYIYLFVMIVIAFLPTIPLAVVFWRYRRENPKLWGWRERLVS